VEPGGGEARIAETAIAAVLVIGLVVARLRPSVARAAGLAERAGSSGGNESVPYQNTTERSVILGR
jgi:hypothetical protein